MIYGSLEEHGRRGVRVGEWELEGELESKAGIRGGIGAEDGGGPVKEILGVVGEGGDVGGGGHHELHEFCLETVEKRICQEKWVVEALGFGLWAYRLVTL